MTSVRIDASELTRFAERMARAPETTRRRVWDQVRRQSFALERRVKIRMPVDTGRARASWAHSTPPADPDDGIWEENERELWIEQGSKVQYIQRLNEGWSRQAPAGFIDAERMMAQRDLEDAVTRLLQDIV